MYDFTSLYCLTSLNTKIEINDEIVNQLKDNLIKSVLYNEINRNLDIKELNYKSIQETILILTLINILKVSIKSIHSILILRFHQIRWLAVFVRNVIDGQNVN